MPEADFSRFYFAAPRQAEAFSAIPTEALSYEVEQLLAGGMWQPAAELVMRRDSGRREPTSIGYAGTPDLMLISSAFEAALVDGGCTGWSTLAVDIRHENGSNITGCRLLTVTGRCATLRQTSTPADADRPNWGRGVSFTGWDGSDVFKPEDAGGIVFSDRVRATVTAHRLRDVVFEPLSESEVWLGG